MGAQRHSSAEVRSKREKPLPRLGKRAPAPTASTREQPHAPVVTPVVTTDHSRPLLPERAQRQLSHLSLAAGFILTYTLATHVADLVAIRNGATPWFPPCGLSLSATLTFGWAGALVVGIADAGQLLVRDTGVAPAQALALGILQTLVWAGVGHLLRPRISLNKPLHTLAEVKNFAMIGLVGGAVLNATLVVGLMRLLGLVNSADTATTMARFLVGDGIGVLSLTPPLLALTAWLLRPQPLPERLQQVGKWRLTWLVCGLLLMICGVGGVWVLDGRLLPAALLPVVIIALRYGMPAAGVATALWTTCGVVTHAFSPSAIDLTTINASLTAGGLLALGAGALVSERERSRQRMAYLALHDEVTGLANRRQIVASLTHALHERAPTTLTVLVVRLTQLPEPTTSGGREIREHCLRHAADVLMRLCPSPANVARMSSDSFIVMSEGPQPLPGPALSSRLLDALTAPLPYDGGELLLGPAIGIARGKDATTGTDLLEQASRAAGLAARNSGHLALFDPTLTEQDRRDSDVEHDLRDWLGNVEQEPVHATTAGAEQPSGLPVINAQLLAVTQPAPDAHPPLHGLQMHFQPIVATGPRRVLGAESLLRWNHPQQGWINPQRVVSVAQSTGLMLPLGRWVLRRSCEVAASWNRGHIDTDLPGGGLGINVNVSAVQLLDERFIGQLIDIVHAAGLHPARLCLEITESALLEDFAVVRERLGQLRTFGVRIALDDFGTAYSSLTWLQQLPLTALKIDRSFVTELTTNPIDQAIVSSTVTLARRLGLTTIGEGVETFSQLHALGALGCTQAQGFALSHPLPDHEFHPWLTANARV